VKKLLIVIFRFIRLVSVFTHLIHYIIFTLLSSHKKTFINNVTTQVVKRHIVRDLKKKNSLVAMNGLFDTKTQAIVSKSLFEKRQRDLLENKVKKLSDERSIFRDVMRSAAS